MTKRKSRENHGLKDHPLYRRWADAKTRCYNPKTRQYKNYGDRGIGMYDGWIYNFKSYFDYMISLPNAMRDGYSIDRIDNDGNYEPGNVRWVEYRQQQINRRLFKNNTSGYKGVHPYRDRFMVIVRYNGESKYVGTAKTKEEGVLLRNKYIIKNNMETDIIQII